MSLYRQGKVPGSFYDGYGQEAVSAGAAFAMAPRGPAVHPAPRPRRAPHPRRDAGADPRPVHGPRDRRHRAAATATSTSATAQLGCVGMVSMLPDMMLVATGMAMAFKLRGERRCAITWFGDGSTSRGDFHEAMNWAGVQKLPVIFVLENNQYAYSTPLDKQFAVDPVRARGGLRVRRRDRRRQRRRGDVRGHARGPRARAGRRRADADRGGDDAHARPRRPRRHEVRAQGAGRGVAQARPDRPPGGAAGAARRRRRRAARRGRRPRSTPPARRRWPRRCPTRHRLRRACSARARPSRSATGWRRGAASRGRWHEATLTYLQAISSALRDELRADERVLVMGEDIGVFGGAFKVTDGFIEEFGADRVMDTPLAESAIIGCAVGAAVVGHAPGVRDAVLGLHLLRLRPARQRRRQDALPPGPGRADHRPAALGRRLLRAARSTPRTPRRGSCTSPGIKVVAPVDRGGRQGPAARRDPRSQPGVLHGAQAPLPAGQGRGARGRLRDAVHRPGRAAREPTSS